jgi:hypothetical protein
MNDATILHLVINAGGFGLLAGVLYWLGRYAVPQFLAMVAELIASCAAERKATAEQHAAERKETADQHERELARFADAIRPRQNAPA